MIPRKSNEQEKERITGKGKEFQGFGSLALHSRVDFGYKVPGEKLKRRRMSPIV